MAKCEIKPVVTFKGPLKQKGAALFTVVILFLFLLPLLYGVFMKRSLQNTMMTASSFWREQAADAANQALAALRPQIDAQLANGLLEYSGTPPAWFISSNAINVRSSGFWQTCAQNNLCQQVTQTLANNTASQQFTIRQLVTPTGLTDPKLCQQQGFVAVFYNIFIDAHSNNPAAGGANIQALYRSCQML